MDYKAISLAILGMVAVISLTGLVVLFNGSSTANVAYRGYGQAFSQAGGMNYNPVAVLCENLIGTGQIPKGFDYEASYSEMVNRFGSNNCVDATAEISYWCCDSTVLGKYY